MVRGRGGEERTGDTQPDRDEREGGRQTDRATISRVSTAVADGQDKVPKLDLTIKSSR